MLLIPSPPLIKVSITRPCSKLGGTTLNGREEGVQCYISQTSDKHSDVLSYVNKRSQMDFIIFDLNL